jgi:hypothetical protein
MVTTDVVTRWRDNNFGFALLKRPLTADALVREVKRYNVLDAAGVSEFIRNNGSLSLYLDRLEKIHQAMLARDASTRVDRTASILSLGNAFRPLMSAYERAMQAETRKAKGRRGIAHSRAAGYRLRRLLPHWLRIAKSRLSE